MQNFLNRIPEAIIYITSGLTVTAITALVVSLFRKIKEKHAVHKDVTNVNEAFVKIGEIYTKKKIDHLRITVNIGNYILPAIQNSKLSFNNCEILLRRRENEDKKYLLELDRVMKDWQILQINKRINNLNIKTLDFFLLDWHVIVDDKIMILGLNVTDKKHIYGFDTSNVKILLIESNNKDGIKIIEEYTNRYDDLFNIL